MVTAIRRWPACTWIVCRRTAPRRAAWSVTAAMMVLAGAVAGALGLLAWPLAAVMWLIVVVAAVAVGAVGWAMHDTERLFEALRR